MTLILALTFSIQLGYWLFFFLPLARHKGSDQMDTKQQKLSIVLCVRNAAEALKQCLPLVLSQNLQDYEVNLVDDNSQDNTIEIAVEIDNRNGRLRLHKNNKNTSGKKGALMTGIKNSSHPWLLFTDCDCFPDENWGRSMLNTAISNSKKIVLGYSPYKRDKTLLGLWTHFEAWKTGLLYLSFAIKGLPYMGVGRNMLYHKSLFDADQILKYQHLQSGDDDLTIMQIATAQNTTINLDPLSFVPTLPEDSWNKYYRQKTRHYSTAHAYKFSTKMLLSGYSISHILFYFSLAVLCFYGHWQIAIAAYSLRLMIIGPIVQRLIKKLKGEFNLLHFCFLDFCIVIYYLVFSLSVLFPQKTHWK